MPIEAQKVVKKNKTNMFNSKNIFGLYKGDGVTTFHNGNPGREALEKCQDIMKEASAIHLVSC